MAYPEDNYPGPGAGQQPPGYQPPGQQPPGQQPPGYHAPPPSKSGFWSRLFDFSFEEFITPSIVKVLFIIGIIVICLSVLFSIVLGFWGYGAWGIVVLIGALIYGFLWLLFFRVALEVFVVFFRIRDNTEEIVSRKR